MQTFLPYPEFSQSAEVLDKKRCWKQVVEAKQIISVLEGTSTAWRNHPAVKMWEGRVFCLKCYFNEFLYVSIKKHKINTTMSFFPNCFKWEEPDEPWWLGNENFHRAMRSRLIEKDEAFYLPLFPDDKGFNDGKYFWPVMDGTKTFKII